MYLYGVLLVTSIQFVLLNREKGLPQALNFSVETRKNLIFSLILWNYLDLPLAGRRPVYLVQAQCSENEQAG